MRWWGWLILVVCGFSALLFYAMAIAGGKADEQMGIK